MMTRMLLARCAPVAIAASLAFHAAPAFAQDAPLAEPAIVLPSAQPAPVAPVSAAVPTIVLPDAAPPVVTTSAAVEAAPEPLPAAATRSSAARTARTSAADRPTAPVVSPRAAAPIAASLPAAVPAVAAPVMQAPAEPVSGTPVVRDTGTNEVAAAGLLGALGLVAVGGIAFFASRRRRSHIDEAPSGDTYEPISAGEALPVRTAAAPVYAAPLAASNTAAPVLARTSTAGHDPVALPDAVPVSFEERDALLRQLVAAEPDKANPFTSQRARARRAKLIIQSLARDFISHKPRIDLSEYTHRWPALRGWQPATA